MSLSGYPMASVFLNVHLGEHSSVEPLSQHCVRVEVLVNLQGGAQSRAKISAVCEMSKGSMTGRFKW
jgi:hypothetical protein